MASLPRFGVGSSAPGSVPEADEGQFHGFPASSKSDQVSALAVVSCPASEEGRCFYAKQCNSVRGLIFGGMVAWYRLVMVVTAHLV